MPAYEVTMHVTVKQVVPVTAANVTEAALNAEGELNLLDLAEADWSQVEDILISDVSETARTAAAGR
jgi:hypothetical protein